MGALLSPEMLPVWDSEGVKNDGQMAENIMFHFRSHQNDTYYRVHYPSLAFRHLKSSKNSVRIGYATEGALFISAQLSTDAVSALRKVRVLTRRGSNTASNSKHARKHEARPPRVKNELRLD